MRPLNLLRSARVWLLVAVPVLLVVACQKDAIKPAAIASDAISKAPILSPLPPIFFNFWKHLADLPFPDGVTGDVPDALVSPLSFSIGDKGYLCGGRTSTSFGQAEELKHLWQYDTASGGGWTQKATYPGAQTPDDGTCFVIGSNAYVVARSGTYEYSQATNTWTARATMPGATRSGATGFAIGSLGYVGCGINLTSGSTSNDFYEYSPRANSWKPIASLPGSTRQQPMSFVIGTNAYVTSGMHYVPGNVGTYVTDTWKYSSATGTWTSKAAFPAAGRSGGVGVSGTVSGITSGYVGTGADNTKFYGDFFRYTESTNTWNSVVTGPPARCFAGSFFIGTNWYVAGGTAGLDGMKDFWTLHL